MKKIYSKPVAFIIHFSPLHMVLASEETRGLKGDNLTYDIEGEGENGTLTEGDGMYAW